MEEKLEDAQRGHRTQERRLNEALDELEEANRLAKEVERLNRRIEELESASDEDEFEEVGIEVEEETTRTINLAELEAHLAAESAGALSVEELEKCLCESTISPVAGGMESWI